MPIPTSKVQRGFLKEFIPGWRYRADVQHTPGWFLASNELDERGRPTIIFDHGDRVRSGFPAPEYIYEYIPRVIEDPYVETDF